MFMQLFLGVLLLMAEQVGVQSGARIGIHNHQNISQGGLLDLYSDFRGFGVPFNTGALAINVANDTARSTSNGAYTLLKEIRSNVLQPGSFLISFDMRSVDGVTNAVARFRVNGVVIGALHSSPNNVFQNYTDLYNVALAEGDLLQIWALSSGGASTTQIRNFRIYYDWRLEYFGDGTRNLLITALPLSDADLLDVTNTPGY